MTSNQIICIMSHMGYVYVEEKSHRGWMVFYSEDDGMKIFTSWSKCEAWMRAHHRFDKARYGAMRETKETRKVK